MNEKIEKFEPNLEPDLNDKLEPNSIKSNTDALDPQFVCLNTDNELPILTNDLTDNAELNSKCA
jgi:hypothetical protein